MIYNNSVPPCVPNGVVLRTLWLHGRTPPEDVEGAHRAQRPREIRQVLLRRGELVGEANELSRVGSALMQQDYMRTNDKSCFALPQLQIRRPGRKAHRPSMFVILQAQRFILAALNTTIMHAVHTCIRLHSRMFMRHLVCVHCDMTLHYQGKHQAL